MLYLITETFLRVSGISFFFHDLFEIAVRVFGGFHEVLHCRGVPWRIYKPVLPLGGLPSFPERYVLGFIAWCRVFGVSLKSSWDHLLEGEYRTLLATSWLNVLLYTSQVCLSIFYLHQFSASRWLRCWILASLVLDGACSIVVMASIYTVRYQGFLIFLVLMQLPSI